jgi:uncharacterized protein YceH (UPF0502 family)
MTVDEEQVTRALEGLRKCGAAAEVFGSGKLPRYRHLAYEWLGVGKEELGIMGELLLRGEQTEGDLRGRASRMDPIPDLDALRGYLDRLADRGLVIWLSPPGRGRMLTHGLLPEEKLAKVRTALGIAAAATAALTPPAAQADADDDPRPTRVEPPRSIAPAAGAELESRIGDLERAVAALQERLQGLEDALGGSGS